MRKPPDPEVVICLQNVPRTGCLWEGLKFLCGLHKERTLKRSGDDYDGFWGQEKGKKNKNNPSTPQRSQKNSFKHSEALATVNPSPERFTCGNRRRGC